MNTEIKINYTEIRKEMKQLLADFNGICQSGLDWSKYPELKKNFNSDIEAIAERHIEVIDNDINKIDTNE